MADGVAGILLMPLAGEVAQIRSTVEGMKILNRSHSHRNAGPEIGNRHQREGATSAD